MDYERFANYFMIKKNRHNNQNRNDTLGKKTF